MLFAYRQAKRGPFFGAPVLLLNSSIPMQQRRQPGRISRPNPGRVAPAPPAWVGDGLYPAHLWHAHLARGGLLACSVIIVLIGMVLKRCRAAISVAGLDEVISFFTNVVLVIPQLPLVGHRRLMGQTNPAVIAIIIGMTSWAWGRRVTRSQTLTLRNREYILRPN